MFKMFNCTARTTSNIPEPRLRMPGDFFKDITGKSVDDFQTIDEIDDAVAKAKKIKGKLPLTHIGGNFVIRNGDVFPHVEMGTGNALLKRIDAALEKKL